MKQIYKVSAIELEKKVNDIADKVFGGNRTPWVIFPSIKLSKEDFIKYRKAKEQ